MSRTPALFVALLVTSLQGCAWLLDSPSDSYTGPLDDEDRASIARSERQHAADWQRAIGASGLGSNSNNRPSSGYTAQTPSFSPSGSSSGSGVQTIICFRGTVPGPNQRCGTNRDSNEPGKGMSR